MLALTAEPTAAADIRALLDDRGFGASRLTVLADLGGADGSVGRRPHGPAAQPSGDRRDRLPADPPGPRRSAPASRPAAATDAFEEDGQITKREIRALALAALAPVPGQLLWDVGAGSGSVGIEWMRVHPASRAIAVEPRADRRERITATPRRSACLVWVVARGGTRRRWRAAPARRGVHRRRRHRRRRRAACWDALDAGGRLVANAVTIEGELALVGWQAGLGGTLTRIAVERAGGLGSFTAWRPALPVSQWSARKPAEPAGAPVTVHFVGAGPGAADLITVRAQRLLSECAVCLYAGSLVPAEVLAHCPPEPG